MNHFQNPNISLTPKRLREIVSMLEEVSSIRDSKCSVLREIYHAILPGNEALREKIVHWSRMPEIPSQEIATWIDSQLIPTQNAKCSELAKKRRQTPRRRYTLKRK